MSNIDTRKIQDHSARIVVLADGIAAALSQIGVAQSNGSYVDDKCKEIKKLAREISKEVGAGSGN